MCTSPKRATALFRWCCCLLFKADVVPVLSPKLFVTTDAYNAFLASRAQFLSRIYADPHLSPTDKVIAFAATRCMDASGTVTRRYESIGDIVGYGKCATRQSLGRLVAARYFSKERIGNRAILTPATPSSPPERSSSAAFTRHPCHRSNRQTPTVSRVWRQGSLQVHRPPWRRRLLLQPVWCRQRRQPGGQGQRLELCRGRSAYR
jgi:hypothetical protein